MYLMAMMLMVSLASCEKKKKTEKAPEIVVENTISADREFMFVNYGEYQWFETSVTMKNFLDEETDGSVESVTSVFQTVVKEDSCFDTKVVITHYDLNGNDVVVKDGFWLDDLMMNNDSLITFKEAFDTLMASNYPKPHSRQCVLRKELGPKVANPQYVFGNKQGFLYVDALTGNVSETSPAFDNK